MTESLQLPICQFGDRIYTVVNGITFYKSTGRNSSHQEAWFPCFGLIKNVNSPAENKKWIIKPSPSIFYQSLQVENTVYFVNPQDNINHIQWEDIPKLQQQRSILLLQAAADCTLKARYLSLVYPQSVGFQFGNMEEKTVEMLTAIFPPHKLLSPTDIKKNIQQSDPTECKQTWKKISNILKDMHHSYYKHVLADFRFRQPPVTANTLNGKLPLYSLDKKLTRGRLMNLPLTLLSYQLFLASRQNVALTAAPFCENTLKFYATVGELLDKLNFPVAPSMGFQTTSFPVFECQTEQGINELNEWIKSNGGIVLFHHADPLDLFKKTRAFEGLVLSLRLKTRNWQLSTEFLKSLGIGQIEIDEVIKKSECYLNAEITYLATLICAQVSNSKKNGRPYENDRILETSCLSTFLTQQEKANLNEIVAQQTRSFFKFESLLDKLIQFFKGLFKKDRVQTLTTHLHTFFKPQNRSEIAPPEVENAPQTELQHAWTS